MARAHTDTRIALAPQRWRLTAVACCGLMLAACGGSAKNGDGEWQLADAPALEDEGNRVPGVFEFPAGGRDSTGAARLSNLLAIDHDDALWFAACGGVVVLHEGQSRFYDASAGIPESVSSVWVDANNRKWLAGSAITGSTLGVLEHGAFRSVLTAQDSTYIRPAANGVVWSVEGNASLSSMKARQLSPLNGPMLPVPTGAEGIAFSAVTDHDGALWLTAIRFEGTDVYRWANGAWTGPFALQQRHFLQYSVEQDALWSFVDDDARRLGRVRWVNGRAEQQIEEGLGHDGAVFLGFDRDGRQIWIADEAIVWARDGIVSEARAMPDDAYSAMLGWNDSVFLLSPSAVYRLDGAEITQVVELDDFRGECR